MSSTMFDTGLHADSAEFHPGILGKPILACGTYQLIENEEGGRAEQQTRIGRVHMLSISANFDGPVEVSSIHSLEVSGIFDLKWSNIPKQHGEPRRVPEAPSLLGHAAADGKLYVYVWDEDSKQLNQIGNCSACSGLALSLDWNNRYTDSPPQVQQAAVSYSDGGISTINVAPDGTCTKNKEWMAHDMEAWITAYNSHDSNLLFSGADDRCFKAWDLRTDCAMPTFKNSKIHEAGVCSIQMHPYVDHIVVTGSYDEHVRFWDIRKTKLPVCSTKVDGGVWRLKFCPEYENRGLLLAACMHAGFKILKFDETTHSSEIIHHYEGGHTSLAYGADWHWEPLQPPVVATASFYDHRLEVWKWVQ
eukprot:m.343368 g.343368  ORF g.343368 m.343368 type:complete len:361 (+) comp22721_c0_seq1:183-1265(+)